MNRNPTGALFRSAFAVLVVAGGSTVMAPAAPSSAAAAPGVTVAAGSYQPLAPTRILDTGTGVGAPAHAVASHATLTFQVSGRGGIPATGASVAVVNLTAASPTGFGYLTAYAAGTTRPHASSLNVTRGHTAANLLVVRLGSGGRVSIFNGSSGTVRLVADVAGYYGAGTPTAAGAFVSVAPSRIFDSVSLLPRTENVTVQVAGLGGVPASGVAAAVLNITVASTTARGYLTAYPFGAARPATSTMGLDYAQNRATAAVVRLGSGGKISIYQGHSGHLRLIVDVLGYIRSGAASQPGTFVPLTSARILDTQSGVGAPAGAVAPGGSVVLQVAGRGGVPATGVSSVTFTLTVADTTESGYVTAYADSARPGTSNLNFRQVENVANLVVTPLRADGTVTLYNGSTGTVRLVADVAGYTL